MCTCSYNCSGAVVVMDCNIILDRFDDFVFLFYFLHVLCFRRSISLQFAHRRITTHALWTPSSATSLMLFRWWVLNIELFLKMGALQVWVLPLCVCNCVCNWIAHVMQIKYCTENNKRLIHFSTCEVYGKTIGSFLPEEYRQVVYQC